MAKSHQRAIAMMKAIEQLEPNASLPFSTTEIAALKESPWAVQLVVDHYHTQEAEAGAIGGDELSAILNTMEQRRRQLEARRDELLLARGHRPGTLAFGVGSSDIPAAIAKLRELGVTGPIRADLGRGVLENIEPLVSLERRLRDRIKAERDTAKEVMSHPYSDERDASADRHYSIADALEELLEEYPAPTPPVTRELREALEKGFVLERGARAIKCECGGYAERVQTTAEERAEYGCGRTISCCDVAFVCSICKTRWVGSQPAPEGE
jgi:hypothetical protein